MNTDNLPINIHYKLACLLLHIYTSLDATISEMASPSAHATISSGASLDPASSCSHSALSSCAQSKPTLQSAKTLSGTELHYKSHMKSTYLQKVAHGNVSASFECHVILRAACHRPTVTTSCQQLILLATNQTCLHFSASSARCMPHSYHQLLAINITR